MNKLYISLAKESDPLVFSQVKKEFEEQGFTVTKFSGGNYNTQLLDEAHIVVGILPKVNITSDEGENIDIQCSRGVYGETLRAESRGFPVYICIEPGKYFDIPEREIHDSGKYDKRYGTLYLSDQILSLKDILSKEGQTFTKSSKDPLKPDSPSKDELDEMFA